MKVSIVTISLNQAEFLSACIESVLGQNYEDLEYIVVDAGSTDASRDVITHYSNKISKIIFEEDKGPADGLNKGFRYATGQVFGYINADDILLPGAVSSSVLFLRQHPHIAVVYGNGVQIDKNNAIVGKIFSTKWDLKRCAYGAVNVLQQGTFFRKSTFESIGGFNPDNHTCWDLELLVDMAFAGAKFSVIQEVTGGFRLHNTSISGSGRSYEAYLRDFARIQRKILGRTFAGLDHILAISFGVEKLFLNPRASVYKIVSAASGNMGRLR